MTTSPTPAPPPPDVDVDLATALGEVALVALVVAVAATMTVGFVVWLLLRAADKPAGSMVTLALSILTIGALAVYAVTRADVMAAVVGTGIGALAGAVTYQLGSEHNGNGGKHKRGNGNGHRPDTPNGPAGG